MQRLGRLQASYFHPGCYGLGKWSLKPSRFWKEPWAL
jgi:hypothetical protein